MKCVRRAAAVAVAACAVAAAACSRGSTPLPPFVYQSYHPATLSADVWPQYRRDNQRTGNNPYQTTITKANVATLKPKWSFHIGPDGAFASPVVANGVVYQADADGHIYALGESTGALMWTYADGVGGLIATPTLSNGLLYEGANPSYAGALGNGIFFAIDASAGTLVHSYPATGQHGGFEGSPLVTAAGVFEGLTNVVETRTTCIAADQLISFDPNSAAILRTLTVTPPGVTGETVWSSPALDLAGRLYVTTGNACTAQKSANADAIMKLDPETLGILWSTQPRPDTADLDIGATPIFVSGAIIAAGKDGNVYALDPANGRIVWKTAAGTVGGSVVGSPATDGSHIYVPFALGQGGTGGAVVALNLDGSVMWTLRTGSDTNGFGVLSAPAVSQGMVFVGYHDVNCTTGACDGISALDADTGAVLWRYPTNHPIYSGPSIVTGGLFAAEFGGSGMYCFTPNGL